MPCSDVNNNSYGGNVMSDRYIPKVGDEFEWETLGGWKRETEVVFETEKQIAVIDPGGFIDLISKDIEFRPIPTKADVERVLLRGLCFANTSEDAAEEIQKAGFTIPKKVSFRDLSESMVGYSMNHNLELWWLEEGKTLLADLVEDEA